MAVNVLICEIIKVLYRLSEAWILRFLKENCSAVNEFPPKAGHLQIQKRVTAGEI